MGKKALSTLLALTMAVSMICVSASAEGTETALTTGGTLESGSYVLNSDVDLSEDIVIPTGADVTIDLAGNTLTGTGEGSVITVYGELTLTDSSGDNSGTVTGGIGTDTDPDNTVVLCGGGVYVDGGEFTMAGGTISGNDCTSADSGEGGGVYVTGDDGTFYLTGGVITDNASYLGGGVAVRGSNAWFIMSGGSITGNTAASGTVNGSGGGLFVSGGYAALNGGTISGNTAYNGGGVTATASATLAVSKSVISGNTATHLGGGVYTATTNVTVKLAGAASITDNEVDGAANNLYLRSGVTVTLDRALTGTVGVTTATAPAEGTAVQLTADDANAADSLTALVSDSTDYVVQQNSDDGYLELAVAPTQADAAKISRATLSLDGSIGVNFYVDMTAVDEADRDNYTVVFTVDGEETTVPYDSTATRNDFGDGVTYYRFTVNVTAAQMTENIQAVLMNGDTQVGTQTYTVKRYCDNAIKGGWSSAALCETLLNYGGYAQTYFGVNTDSLANADLTSDPLDYWFDEFVSSYQAAASGTYPAAIAEDGNGGHFCATLLLESETVIRLYFNLADGCTTEDVTFTVDGETLDIQASVPGDAKYGTYDYYVEIQVPAYHLGEAYDIVVTDGTDTVTVSYSAFAYVNKMVVQGGTTDVDLQNVCKALVFYGLEAGTYNYVD